MKKLAALLCASACLAASPARAAHISRADWGTTQKGEKVDLYTLKGPGGLEAQISNFGAVLVSLKVPDRKGQKADVLLGFDNFAAVEKGGLFGAVIGRFANRLSNNATFQLEGRTVTIDHREGQAVLLHSGPNGFQKRVWTAKVHDGAEPSLELNIFSPNGDTGFPGNMWVTLTYTLTRDHGLKLDYRATSDAATVANLTNHAYFNIGGEGSGDVQDQSLQIFADDYTVNDARGVPNGTIAPVAGTPLDFRQPKRVGDVLHADFPEIARVKGIDVNFVVRGEPGKLRPAAKVTDPKSGRVMEVLTTQPGVQIYSDNVANPVTGGKNGHSYGTWNSLSLETQHFPDAPNHPNFLSTEVTPAKTLHEVTLYRFSTVK